MWLLSYEVRIALTSRVGNRVFPNDKLQVIGTDEQLSVFSGQLEKVAEGYKDEDFENREMYLKQFVIARNSPFCGRTIRESGVRNKYHCLVVELSLPTTVTCGSRKSLLSCRGRCGMGRRRGKEFECVV